MRAPAVVAALALAVAAAPARAYSEFEAWVERASGRFVDCALCHVHPEGPEGAGDGQIRGLDREEMARLTDARTAFEPGRDVDNPLLNDFGDALVGRFGRRGLLAYRTSDPGRMAADLDAGSDLDGDGIPDARELRDGTHPLDPRHGDPWRLFVRNLRTSWIHVAMIGIATALGVFGLARLRRGLAPARPEETPWTS